MDFDIQKLAINALPVIFAITLHEAAHGYVARHFGDQTAWQQGRVTANPLRHIDPVGTILIPLLLLLSHGPVFGWAKPVPVNFGKLRRPKQDMLWVAAAGPGANLLMALCWGGLMKIANVMPEHAYSLAMHEMSMAGIVWNSMLMVLNLLPIPPLDGGRIMVSLLPARAAWKFAQLERFGLLILILLLFTHVLDYVLYPLVSLFLFLIKTLFGI
ncbi:MAG TPA: site-2 protease family protein [Rhodocyclaceae bacterium]